KEVLAVLDEEPLLTDNLMRLTRWMADYYLCGWGQVLNAVVPAGARDGAGTRKQVYVEPVPEAAAVGLPARHAAVRQRLQTWGKPVEVKQLQRLAEVGPGPIKALGEKGLIRRVVRRVDRFEVSGEEDHALGPVTLNGDQVQAWGTLEPALRD